MAARALTPAEEAVPEVPARLSFSGAATEARARVIERSGRWRRTKAAQALLWWLLAPVVFWLPPHIPWVLIVLFLGAWQAFGRLREHRTLLSLHGACPKCGVEQDFGEPGRMKEPHTVSCANCHWDLRVEVAPGAVST